jgi:hypothetical protein
VAKNYLFSEDTPEEVQEWLGITKADILLYAATALVFAAWIIQIKIVQWGLTLAVIALCFYSTKLGMKRSQKVSKFTNIIKVMVYPVFSLILIGIAISVSVK